VLYCGLPRGQAATLFHKVESAYYRDSRIRSVRLYGSCLRCVRTGWWPLDPKETAGKCPSRCCTTNAVRSDSDRSLAVENTRELKCSRVIGENENTLETSGWTANAVGTGGISESTQIGNGIWRSVDAIVNVADVFVSAGPNTARAAVTSRQRFRRGGRADGANDGLRKLRRSEAQRVIGVVQMDFEASAFGERTDEEGRRLSAGALVEERDADPTVARLLRHVRPLRTATSADARVQTARRFRPHRRALLVVRATRLVRIDLCKGRTATVFSDCFHSLS
jgi:hypothetical protein